MNESLEKLKDVEGELSFGLVEGQKTQPLAKKSEIVDVKDFEIKWLKWIDKLNDIGGFIGGIIVPISAFMICYEICQRFFFGSPSTWVTEISTYLIVASTMFAIGYALKEKAHIRVDFLTSSIPARANQILEIVTSILCLTFCLYLFWEGLKLTIDAFIMGERTATIIRAPRFILLGMVPIGGIMLALQYLRNIVGLLKDLHQPEIEKHRQSNAMGIMVSGVFVILITVSILLIKKATVIAATILFFSLLLSGMPVSLALALFGMLGFLFFFESSTIMSQLPLVTYGTLDNNVLAAVPLFIFTSSILVHGKVGPKLYNFASTWLRHLPGGLAIASIVFCGIFSAISGSSVATAATVSLVALPEMLSRGYDRKFALGLLAAGGTLGILFPPSLAMMIYGAMTEESIAQLFMAGTFPGLILSGMFVLYIILLNKFGKTKLPRGDRADIREKWTATKSAGWGLIIPIIIIGGIYSGIFTPTEAASVAVLYSFFACGLIYKTISLPVLKMIVLNGVKTTAMIMLIVVGANLTGQVTAMMQIAQNALQYLLSLHFPPWLFMVSINVFLIILGMPLEAISILVITLPILYPLIVALGFSPLWFAVIMVINMELALISPPEGINLFILQSIGGSSAKEMSWAVVPFLIILALFLVLISVFPFIATWLPKVMME